MENPAEFSTHVEEGDRFISFDVKSVYHHYFFVRLFAIYSCFIGKDDTFGALICNFRGVVLRSGLSN